MWLKQIIIIVLGTGPTIFRRAHSRIYLHIRDSRTKATHHCALGVKGDDVLRAAQPFTCGAFFVSFYICDEVCTFARHKRNSHATGTPQCYARMLRAAVHANKALNAIDAALAGWLAVSSFSRGFWLLIEIGTQNVFEYFEQCLGKQRCLYYAMNELTKSGTCMGNGFRFGKIISFKLFSYGYKL